MSKNIIEIDLNKLDQDIADAQKQLDLLLSARKYAQSLSKLSTPINVTKTESPKVALITKSKASKVNKNKPLGVTDFILKFLNGNDKVDSKAIIKAYSVYCNKTEDEVEVSVGNGLSRLRASKKIKNEKRANRKLGYLWYSIK